MEYIKQTYGFIKERLSWKALLYVLLVLIAVALLDYFLLSSTVNTEQQSRPGRSAEPSATNTR